MGFLDKLKEMAGKHPDKTDQGIEKAGDMIDKRTGGKYSSQIDQGQDKARDALRRQQGGEEEQPPA